jgi:hypothetical protein
MDTPADEPMLTIALPLGTAAPRHRGTEAPRRREEPSL